MKERTKFTTLVNVVKLGEYVEDVVQNVREEHSRGRVVLWNDAKAADVIAFGQFFIGP